ncbi:MAG: phosphatidate cytidylyltransferase [Verrucomicrobiota bacterium]
MSLTDDPELLFLFGGVYLLLIVAHLAAFFFRKRWLRVDEGRFYRNLISRIQAWWGIVIVMTLAMLFGKIAALIVFAVISFQALREFITITPTRPGDHRALCWSFFFILPAQYVAIGLGLEVMAAIFIPVYAFIFIPIRAALAEDTTDFLARTAKVQWGLMVYVYFISHAPALLLIPVNDYRGENMKLLFFLVVIVQLSDVLQYCWGKAIGKRPISQKLSPSKTAEGLVGGIVSTAAIGTLLWWATPFSPLGAFVLSVVLCLMGFFGGLVMSAIKRDRGIKDYGSLLSGHGGIIDRIDSLCFAAPVFYRIIVFFYGS